ncbi:MAG: DUF1641 domain-containing protein [Syntrophobacteraceae bacterium]|jgi:uncharacterized protein YjgD (DUF1641 family)
MNDESLILQQLDHMGKEISSISDSARSLQELREEITPRVNELVAVLIKELAEVEADCTLEDVAYLLKNALRSVRNMNWSLDQLKSLIDFLRSVEPLLRSSVPQGIYQLDQFEQQGIFQIISAMFAVMQKIAQTYTPADFEQIGEGLVRLVGVAKKLTSPNALNLLDKAADIPAKLDLSRAKPVGVFGAAFAMRNPEVKQGMGVLLEITKGLVLLKNGGQVEGESQAATQNREA